MGDEHGFLVQLVPIVCEVVTGEAPGSQQDVVDPDLLSMSWE